MTKTKSTRDDKKFTTEIRKIDRALDNVFKAMHGLSASAAQEASRALDNVAEHAARMSGFLEAQVSGMSESASHDYALHKVKIVRKALGYQS